MNISELLNRPPNPNLDIIVSPHRSSFYTWLHMLFENFWNECMYLTNPRLRWLHNHARELHDIQGNLNNATLLGDEALSALDAMTKAIAASKITLAAKHQEIEPYAPQPQQEEMLFASPDWRQS